MTTIKNPTALALVDAMLSTSTDDFGTPLDKVFSPAEVDPDSVKRIYLEFQQFIDKVEGEIDEVVDHAWESVDDFYIGARPEGCSEFYFICSRNYQGTGFWDSSIWDEKVGGLLNAAAKTFGEITACLSDDGRIYFS